METCRIQATATVAITGGSFDGQVLVFNVAEEDGDWKLNEIESFKKLDSEKLIAAFEEQLEEAKDVEPELAGCVIETLEEGSDSELEELVLGGSSGFAEIAEECVE